MIVEIELDIRILEDTEFTDGLNEFSIQHGGNPKVVGVVKIAFGTSLKPQIRYKVQYPDGEIDYIRFDTFEKYYYFGGI